MSARAQPSSSSSAGNRRAPSRAPVLLLLLARLGPVAIRACRTSEQARARTPGAALGRGCARTTYPSNLPGSIVYIGIGQLALDWLCRLPTPCEMK